MTCGEIHGLEAGGAPAIAASLPADSVIGRSGMPIYVIVFEYSD